VLSCDHFIDALADKDLILKIRERRPRDLDTALQIALELEVWAQDSERFAQDTGRAPQSDAKKVREFTDPGTAQQTGKQNKNSADIQKELSEQRKHMEKMFNEFQKTIAELRVSTHADTPRPAPNAGGAKPWQKQGRAPFYCWGVANRGIQPRIVQSRLSQKLLRQKLYRRIPRQHSKITVNVRSRGQMLLRIIHVQKRARVLLRRIQMLRQSQLRLLRHSMLDQ